MERTGIEVKGNILQNLFADAVTHAHIFEADNHSLYCPSSFDACFTLMKEQNGIFPCGRATLIKRLFIRPLIFASVHAAFVNNIF
jgi:hypothetical protein